MTEPELLTARQHRVDRPAVADDSAPTEHSGVWDMSATPFSRREFLITTTAAAVAPLATAGGVPPAEAAISRVFHVSPDGDDTGPGTSYRPFRTPHKARDAVRAFKHGQRTGDITVYFRHGTYVLTETLEFGVEDSGNAQQTITYVAYPGETAVFSSAAALTHWQIAATPPGLPAAALGNVWVADMPSGWQAKILYEDGRMLPVARSADFRFGKPNEPLGRVFVRSGDQFASLHLRRAGLAILRVDGRTVSGYRADLRGAQIRYASSNSLVALVTPLGGIVTGLFGGAAEITVTVTKGAVTKTTSIVVIVG